MVVRELLTVLGFKTDEHGMKKAEEGFDKIKESAIHLMEIVGAIEIGKKILEAAGEEEQLAMVFEQDPRNKTKLDTLRRNSYN